MLSPMSRNVLRDHKTLTEEIDGAFFAASGVKRILVSFLTVLEDMGFAQHLTHGLPCELVVRP